MTDNTALRDELTKIAFAHMLSVSKGMGERAPTYKEIGEHVRVAVELTLAEMAR